MIFEAKEQGLVPNEQSERRLQQLLYNACVEGRAIVEAVVSDMITRTEAGGTQAGKTATTTKPEQA